MLMFIFEPNSFNMNANYMIKPLNLILETFDSNLKLPTYLRLVTLCSLSSESTLIMDGPLLVRQCQP